MAAALGAGGGGSTVTDVAGGLSPGPAYWVAAAILVGATLALHFLLKWQHRPQAATGAMAQRRSGLWAAVVGIDGRVSTSKLQFALWTYAIGFVLLAIVLENQASLIADGLNEQYLWLLGIPTVGAVGAKAITSSKVSGQRLDKAPTDQRLQGAGARAASLVAETVSDDSGLVDLGDLQYFFFNIVALTFFLQDFFSVSPAQGLPVIPDSLVALTSVSALGYLSKKGVISDVPVISSVYPSTVPAGGSLHVRGYGLITRPKQGVTAKPEDGLVVLVGGVETTLDLAASNLTGSPVDLVVTVADTTPTTPPEQEVVVITASGATTEPRQIKVITATPP